MLACRGAAAAAAAAVDSSSTCDFIVCSCRQRIRRVTSASSTRQTSARATPSAVAVGTRAAAALTSGGSRLGGAQARPSKSWLWPPDFAVLLTHCGRFVLRKVSKFDATRCRILRLKCTKFDFRWGSLQRSPGPLPILVGAYF